jgi:hypothetical protein
MKTEVLDFKMRTVLGDPLRSNRTRRDASEGDADFDGPFAVVIPARQH